MNRLLLTLLLLASSWSMATGAGAELRGQDRIAPLTPGSAAEALRAGGGIELASALERSGAGGAGERSPPSPLVPQAGAELRRLQALHVAEAASLGRQGVVLPRFAHLPYFATAPPRTW